MTDNFVPAVAGAPIAGTPIAGTSFTDIMRVLNTSMGRPVTMTLPLADLVLDDHLQMRVERSARHIEEDLIPKIEGGATLHAITVYQVGNLYYVTDGRHRIEAYRRLGYADIVCEVFQGTWDDAFSAALTANQSHGLHLTTRDKRRIIESAIAHWKSDLESGALSVQELARRVGSAVSRSTVYNIVSDMGIVKAPTITVNLKDGRSYETSVVNTGTRRDRPEHAKPVPAHIEPREIDMDEYLASHTGVLDADAAALQAQMAMLANENAVGYAEALLALDPADGAQPDDYDAGMISLLVTRRVALRLYELIHDLEIVTADDRALVRALTPQLTKPLQIDE